MVYWWLLWDPQWYEVTHRYQPNHGKRHHIQEISQVQGEQQELNQSKLVRVSNGNNQVLWTKYFLECQGYQLYSSTIYQDNEASILLKHNGKMPSGKKTRHINIQYFSIINKVQNREIDIGYFSTGEMITDYCPKLL